MCTGSQDLYSCGCSLVSFESTCTYFRCKDHKEFKPRLLEKRCNSCHRLNGTAIELTKASSSTFTNSRQAQKQVNGHHHPASDFPNPRVVPDSGSPVLEDDLDSVEAHMKFLAEYDANDIEGGGGGASNNSRQATISETSNGTSSTLIPLNISNLGPQIVSLADPFLKQVITAAKSAAHAEIQAHKQATIDAMYASIKNALNQATSLRDVDVSCERANVKQWIKSVKEGVSTLEDMKMGLWMSGEGMDLGRSLNAEKVKESILQECMKTLAGTL